MKKTALKIKIGDKVNRHEKGWSKVVWIKKGFMVYITFENGDVIPYDEYDELFIAET